MLVQNYGLFWQREKVNWGTPGRGGSGTLMGRYARRRTSDGVDFRLQRGVYVLYDDNFRIVYVGQAGRGKHRLFIRLRTHKNDHLAQRWSRFSWFGILPVLAGSLDADAEPPGQSVEGTLNHMEAILIAAAEPPLNLQSGRFGSDVEQYLQDGSDIDGDDEE